MFTFMPKNIQVVIMIHHNLLQMKIQKYVFNPYNRILKV